MNDEVQENTNTAAQGSSAHIRLAGDWKTRYTDAAARRSILIEAIYLLSCLFVSGAALFFFWFRGGHPLWGLPVARYHSFCIHAYALLAGLMAGSLFALSWLRRAVAFNMWDKDHFWWRITTPLLSGVLGVICVCLVESGLLSIFDSKVVDKPAADIGLGFLTGYFSDLALFRFAEIAHTIFGTGRKNKTEE
ncbi:MAG: hypothetical protein M1587_11745 [Thaumarchaeota archaeon]|nr:hypothetical protein [Nitrososphaerota archaeon]